MQEEFNPFRSGQALETLSVWSDHLKSFQQRVGKYFARSEAKGAAFDYIRALLCLMERKKVVSQKLLNGRVDKPNSADWLSNVYCFCV